MKMSKGSIRRNLEGCYYIPIIIGMLMYAKLYHWRRPTHVPLTEKGMNYFIDLPRWFLFENTMESEVRVRAGDGRGEMPKKLRGQGLLLRPGQKRKIYFPHDCYYRIEFYGVDGKKLEQLKLRAAIRHDEI